MKTKRWPRRLNTGLQPPPCGWANTQPGSAPHRGAAQRRDPNSPRSVQSEGGSRDLSPRKLFQRAGALAVRRRFLADVAGLVAFGPRMAVSVEQAKLEEKVNGRCSAEEPAGLESRCGGRSVGAVAGWGGRGGRAWGLRYVFFRFKGLGY